MMKEWNKAAGFTLAEVLITLGIIGVVAAMTIPSLIVRQEKTQTLSRLKKVYSALNQAMIQSQADNGDYSSWETGAGIEINSYFAKYWEPYFKGARICPTSKSCGYTSDFAWQNMNGSSVGWGLQTSASRILVQLADGTTIFLPIYTMDADNNPAYVNYIFVDLNGSSKPNVLGKDVFMFNMVSGKGVKPYMYNSTAANIDIGCAKTSTGSSCAAKIIKDGWLMKDDYPW